MPVPKSVCEAAFASDFHSFMDHGVRWEAESVNWKTKLETLFSRNLRTHIRGRLAGAVGPAITDFLSEFYFHKSAHVGWRLVPTFRRASRLSIQRCVHDVF
jgi:hypothetical protein